MIKHYRVDKMEKIKLLPDRREGREQFNGEDAKVSLYCENHLAGVIIDRFGKDVMMIPKGEDHFSVSVIVAVSPQFFGWITGIGTGIRIEGPEHVKKQYADYLSRISKLYND